MPLKDESFFIPQDKVFVHVDQIKKEVLAGWIPYLFDFVQKINALILQLEMEGSITQQEFIEQFIHLREKYFMEGIFELVFEYGDGRCIRY